MPMPMNEIKLTDEITVRLIQSMGGDRMVVAAARVSTSGEDALRFAEGDDTGSSFGLINYLMKHRHGSPFEHSLLTFFVHVPAMVWWEWVRHRIGFSYSLESGRYKELEPVFWIPRRDRKMHVRPGHKPARPRYDEVIGGGEFQMVIDTLKAGYESNWKRYQELIAMGIANEVARAVLGFGVYYSGWVTCNPRSLMAFLSLRTHEEGATFVSYPQAEIEQAARATEEIFEKGWPLTYQSFCANGRVGP